MLVPELAVSPSILSAIRSGFAMMMTSPLPGDLRSGSLVSLGAWGLLAGAGASGLSFELFLQGGSWEDLLVYLEARLDGEDPIFAWKSATTKTSHSLSSYPF